jgi:hypothetical protein
MSIINSVKTNTPSFLFTEAFFLNYDQNIYENLFCLFDSKLENSSLLNNFLSKNEKKISKTFSKLIIKYFKLYLFHKGTMNQSPKDKFLKIGKSKIQEVRNIVKDRCVGDITIEEDFQEKLRYILDKIGPKKDLNKGRTSNERMISTSAGTNDSFQNVANSATLKKPSADVFRKTMFRIDNRREEFEKMPVELNNILETESPDKSVRIH